MSFGAPYRKGGSSRYLTIATVITSPDNKTHYYPKRLVKKLYQKYNWNPKQEMKWAEMSAIQSKQFAIRVKGMVRSHSSINLSTITVYKPQVQAHIRKDPNKLYNYMIGFLLIDKMAEFDHVLFHPDPRSIKVESGNSLHDYLQTKLWFERGVATKLTTVPYDSMKNKGVQFADMLSGVVQQHYEDQKSIPFNILNSRMDCKKLYFKKAKEYEDSSL